ncbi:MAG: branched-chain amino acid ABC transporter permease [Firmicutes bacterium]|nr:branched-chain amino acid ABC transporter permease [Bacillota bacterium]
MVMQMRSALFLGLLCLFPVVFQNLYYIHLINMAMITMIVAMGLNVLVGYCGQISIGHAAFWAVGAYASGLATTRFGMPFIVGLIASILTCAALGYVVGRPTLRLRGAYLAIASIGVGEIVQLVLLNWIPVTGGALGMKSIPFPSLFGFEFDSSVRLYYLILAVTAGIFAITGRIASSPLGRAFRAVKQNEVAAEVMGVDTAHLKLLAFVISTAYAGVAGSLYAHMQGYLSPYGFGFRESVSILCMVLAGGMGHQAGPIVGVLLLMYAREAFRPFQDYQLVVYGLLLIGVIVFMPKGVVGSIPDVVSHVRRWLGRRESRAGPGAMSS